MVFKGSTEGPRLGTFHNGFGAAINRESRGANPSKMGGRKEEGWRVQQSLVVPPSILKIELPSCIPLSTVAGSEFEWLENDGGRSIKGGEKRERESPLIGRMIPANPEKLEWKESPASLCQKLEGKWAKCHAFGTRKSPANPLG